MQATRGYIWWKWGSMANNLDSRGYIWGSRGYTEDLMAYTEGLMVNT